MSQTDTAIFRKPNACAVGTAGGHAVADPEELGFIDWWTARLMEFCYDDIAGGLFTDQRWIDMAPCFFEDIDIVRSPGFNVATWNLSQRVVAGDLDHLTVNGEPLFFYHFSGFDSGAQEVMLEKYGQPSPILKDLRAWYIEECKRKGQEAYGRRPSIYQFFENGNQITKAHRLLYRWRQYLVERYPDPYHVSQGDDCYHQWFVNNGAHALQQWLWNHPMHAFGHELLESQTKKLRTELDAVYQSRSWRIASLLSKLAHPLRR